MSDTIFIDGFIEPTSYHEPDSNNADSEDTVNIQGQSDPGQLDALYGSDDGAYDSDEAQLSSGDTAYSSGDAAYGSDDPMRVSDDAQLSPNDTMRTSRNVLRPSRKSPRSNEGSKEKSIEIHELANIESYVFTYYRNMIVAAINGYLEDGELTRVLNIPVISQAVSSDNCRFTSYRVWRRNQVDYLIDVDVNIEKLSVEGRHGDYVSTFGVYVTLWFHFGETYEVAVEEIGALYDRPDRDLIKMDQNMAPILSTDDIEEVAVDIWNAKVKGAMIDAKLRKAFILADKYGLKIAREHLAGVKEDHILCFHDTTIELKRPKVGELDDIDAHKVEHDADSDVVVRSLSFPAKTIVLNTAKSQGDEYALAIYKACFEYEFLYAFFSFNGCADSRMSQLKKKSVTITKKRRIPKDPTSYISVMTHLGGFALMLPLKIMQDKVWREYQRACLCKPAQGYINHDGFRYAMVIRHISEDFLVANFRVRQKIVKMGRITAKGALNYDYDCERYFTPFGFSCENADKEEVKGIDGSNRIETTFTIRRRKLFEIYNSNPKFRELMATGDFAFIDGLVCLNDSDHLYMAKGAYRMTEFANARADLCCLRFTVEYVNEHALFGFSHDGYNKIIISALNRHSSVTLSEREAYKRNLMNSMPEKFPEALRYLMANHPGGSVSTAILAKRSFLPEETINSYCSDSCCLYKLDEVMGICLGLNLTPWETNALLEKANMSVGGTDARCHYAFIRDCLFMEPVSNIQKFLIKNRFQPLELANYQINR